MRVSTIKQDVGFSPNAKVARVTLDGVDVQDFITADEEAGFVRVGAEVRRGKVEIIQTLATEVSKPSRFSRRDQ